MEPDETQRNTNWFCDIIKYRLEVWREVPKRECLNGKINATVRLWLLCLVVVFSLPTFSPTRIFFTWLVKQINHGLGFMPMAQSCKSEILDAMLNSMTFLPWLFCLLSRLSLLLAAEARTPATCLNLISLGRPEIFEKVGKIGVGVHIWLLQVSKLTHH